MIWYDIIQYNAMLCDMYILGSQPFAIMQVAYLKTL